MVCENGHGIKPGMGLTGMNEILAINPFGSRGRFSYRKEDAPLMGEKSLL